MNLKDWMNKIEKQQLDEVAPPAGAIAIPSIQGQGNVQASFVAPAKQGDKTTTDILNTLAKNKSIVTVGAQPVSGQTQQTTQQPAQQKPGMTAPGQMAVQEEEIAEVAPPGMEDVVLALKKKFPGHPEKAFAIAWHNYNQKHGKKEESIEEGNYHDHDFVEKSARHERLRDLAKRMGDQEKYDFHDAEIKKLYSKDKQDTKESMMSESKQINESVLEEILANHPHEHKMAQEGWGMNESLLHALADHYYKEGRIPRAIWHGPTEELHAHIEECYMEDTGVVLGEDDLDSDEIQLDDGAYGEGIEEGFMDTVKKVGGKVLDTLGHGSDEELLDKIRPSKEEPEVDHFADELDEETELERMLKEPTSSMRDKKVTPKETESSMFESKKYKMSEATKETKTGRIHTADAGGYGRKDDEDEEGKKVADTVKRGRGRPKKGGDETGEVKKYDWSAFGASGKDVKLPKWDKKKTTTHKIATKADREDLEEGETIEKKGGRVHKGSYGTSYEAGDEGVAKEPTTRGRGRPKKGADSSGEVKKYDFSAFGATGKDVKLPKWDKKKTTTHKIATKADREDEVMEAWDRQLKGLLTEGLTVSTSVGNQGGQDSVSITASDEDAHKLLALLNNAGVGSGVPSHAVKTATTAEPSIVHDKTDGRPSVKIAPPPTTTPEYSTTDQEEVIDALGHVDADDTGEDALEQLKKLLGRHGSEPVGQEVQEEKGEKKPDEDGDGVPDWADKKPGKDDHAEEDKEDKEEVKEEMTCEGCGEHLEEGHECDQLNEWANSPQGQSDDEQFDADINFMTKAITAGLNGQKSTGQATTPVLASQTNRQMSEGYNIDVAAEMRKLAGIR